MLKNLCQNKIFPRLKRSITKVTGLENVPRSGPVIFAANHVDRLDGVLLFVLLKDLIKQPIIFLSKVSRYNMVLTHSAIPLSKYSKQEALEKCQKHLSEGGALVIFPEGARNNKKNLLRGKTGAARLSLWTGAQVVPVGIVSPAFYSFFYSLLVSLFRKKEVAIRIGQPLHFKRISKKDTSYAKLQEVTREIMGNVALLCGKAYRW